MAGDVKKGETDDTMITASGAKLPAWQKLSRTSSIEKFVYETDKKQSVVFVQVDSVSICLIVQFVFMSVSVGLNVAT